MNSNTGRTHPIPLSSYPLSALVRLLELDAPESGDVKSELFRRHGLGLIGNLMVAVRDERIAKLEREIAELASTVSAL